MAAYVLANITVTDPAAFAAYAAQVKPTLDLYGGRYIVRGGAIEPIEGTTPFDRLVILEFPSMPAAKAWYNSPEYAPLLAMRVAATQSNLAFVEGYSPA